MVKGKEETPEEQEARKNFIVGAMKGLASMSRRMTQESKNKDASRERVAARARPVKPKKAGAIK